jgi:hypothetical protein
MPVFDKIAERIVTECIDVGWSPLWQITVTGSAAPPLDAPKNSIARKAKRVSFVLSHVPTVND